MDRNIYKFSIKQFIFLVIILSVLFTQGSTEIPKIPNMGFKHPPPNYRKPTTKKPTKTLTPKKYRKNFVIRIPKTQFSLDGPKRITITKTTPPASIAYEIPTHTSDETTTYYSTFAYDFISPSPQLSRVFKYKKSNITPQANENKAEPIPKTAMPNTV